MRIKPIVGQFIFLLTLSLGLIFLDFYFQGKNALKQYLTTVARPIYQIVDYPYQATEWLSGWFSDRQELTQTVEALELENALLKIKLQQLESNIYIEKTRQAQADAAKKFTQKILFANILNVNLERHSQKIVVDKGQKDSVYLGQPVIDQDGIIGQVTELSVAHSIITLITDATQSTPVLVKRNALRTLLYGTGQLDLMEIKFLGAEADIREGDFLISSGIGNRYPTGYPVAQVVKINRDDNESFLDIAARPLAKLNHGEQVLMIWPHSNKQSPNPHYDSIDEALSLNQHKAVR